MMRSFRNAAHEAYSWNSFAMSDMRQRPSRQRLLNFKGDLRLWWGRRLSFAMLAILSWPDTACSQRMVWLLFCFPFFVGRNFWFLRRQVSGYQGMLLIPCDDGRAELGPERHVGSSQKASSEAAPTCRWNVGVCLSTWHRQSDLSVLLRDRWWCFVCYGLLPSYSTRIQKAVWFLTAYSITKSQEKELWPSNMRYSLAYLDDKLSFSAFVGTPCRTQPVQKRS